MVTLPSLVIFCSQLIKRCIECIEIYAVDSAIQLLSHWGLVDSFRSENSGPEQSMKSIIDGNRLLIIIDYQYQSMIDGNRSIKIVTPKRRPGKFVIYLVNSKAAPPRFLLSRPYNGANSFRD